MEFAFEPKGRGASKVPTRRAGLLSSKRKIDTRGKVADWDDDDDDFDPWAGKAFGEGDSFTDRGVTYVYDGVMWVGDNGMSLENYYVSDLMDQGMISINVGDNLLLAQAGWKKRDKTAGFDTSSFVVVPDPDDDEGCLITLNGETVAEIGWTPSNLRLDLTGSGEWGDEQVYTLYADDEFGNFTEVESFEAEYLRDLGAREARTKSAYAVGDRLDWLGNTYTRDEQGWWWPPLGSTADILVDKDINEAISYGGDLLA